jgi:hypothetical protein
MRAFKLAQMAKKPKTQVNIKFFLGLIGSCLLSGFSRAWRVAVGAGEAGTHGGCKKKLKPRMRTQDVFQGLYLLEPDERGLSFNTLL